MRTAVPSTFFTDTIVPAQEINDGTIEMSVLEGRLGRIRVERIDEAPVSEARIFAIASQLPTGRPLTQRQLERTMLMLSDTPGMATQASLETGDEAGTYDLVIEVKAAPRTNFTVDIDNQGSASTGRYRAGILGRINSPLGIGDNLDLRLLNSFGKGLLFGRLAYEMPVGASGLRASAAAAHIQYELGAGFAALDAHGTADVVELGATFPLLRSRLLNLFSKAGIEYKRLDDRIGVVDQVSNKHVTNLNAGLIYERRDQLFGGGFVSGGLDLYRGHLDIRSAQDVAIDQGANGRRTNGSYARVTYQASRLQYLNRSPQLLFCRGRPVGQPQPRQRRKDRRRRPAHGAGVFSVHRHRRRSDGPECRSALEPCGRCDPERVSTISAACAPTTRPAALEQNRITLSGLGLGLYKVVATGTALRATVGWPLVQTGEPAVPREHGARVFGQLVKAF